MIPLNISLDHGDGVTVLSNYFIDHYMKDANDAQIKIYLYLLRMVSANLPTDIAEITEKFNYTEKDVLRALSYWEKLHLLSIDYDQRNNMTGIRLCNPAPIYPVSLQDETLEPAVPVTFHIIPSGDNTSNNIVKIDYTKEKNAYTADDIARFKENPESEQLLFAAQQYLKRTISGPEIKTLLFIYDRLGFGLDLTDYLLQYCIDQGQTKFYSIERTAIQWFEKGIKDIRQAKEFLQAKSVSADPKVSLHIMELLGKKRTPAKAEQEFINRWLVECAYPLELIEEACNRTVMRVESNHFPYADSILKSWNNDHINSLSDLAAWEAQYNANKENAHQTAGAAKASTPGQAVNTRQSGSGKQSGFCKIEQHNYDFDNLEKILTNK